MFCEKCERNGYKNPLKIYARSLDDKVILYKCEVCQMAYRIEKGGNNAEKKEEDR